MRFILIFIYITILSACAVDSSGWEKFNSGSKTSACNNNDEYERSKCIGALVAYKNTERACKLAKTKHNSNYAECINHNNALFTLYQSRASYLLFRNARLTRSNFDNDKFTIMLKEWEPNCKTTSKQFSKCNL